MPVSLLVNRIIFLVGGTLSCLGSGYVIQDVLRNPHKRSKSTYHRIMVGLSIMDIIYTLFAFVLGPCPMPKGSYLWAVGNIASCDAAAFISAVGYLGSPLYNCSLATFYALRLKYNWSEHRINKAEKWIHIVTWSIPILFSITALSTKTLGPSFGGFCGPAVTGYPFFCNASESEVECIRGGETINEILIFILFFFPFLCILYVSTIMIGVYRAVQDVEANALSYSFAVVLRRAHDRRKTMKRSRRVMIQGMLYSAAMILTWIFPFIHVMLNLITGERSKVMFIFAGSFNQFQGAFNFLIYLVPTFRKMLKKHRQQKQQSIQLKNEENVEITNDDIFPSQLPVSPGTPMLYHESVENYVENTNVFTFREDQEEEKQEIASSRPAVYLEMERNCEHEEDILSEIQSVQSDKDDDDSDDYY